MSPLGVGGVFTVTGQETTGLPARGYSWPPFQPGNEWRFQPGHELSLRHGAWSARHVQPVATQILQTVLDDPQCDYLKAPRFAAELQAWATAEARCRLLESYIAKLAEGDDTGVGDLADEATRAAWALLHRCETRAQSGRDRLGLSPLSAARIGRDKAAAGIDVAMIMKELHKLAQAGVDVSGGASQDVDIGDDD